MACDCVQIDMTRAKAELDAILAEVLAWPDGKIEAFEEFWNALVAEGAQVGEFTFTNGNGEARVSDDLRRAVAEFRGQP